MATRAIRFTVLDVGQGTGNFVEIFDTKTPTLTTAPVKTFLIDLGSERKKTEAGGPSADWVVTQLNRMASPEMDCVILSHSDSDHINLLELVLSAFDPPGTTSPTKPILTIQKSYYGGDYNLYSKRGKNVLRQLDTYCVTSPESFPTSCSSYTADPVAPFRTIDGVDLYLMIGNAPRSAASASVGSKRSRVDSFAINTKSLVVVVSWGIQYIATGDATGVTLARCNDVVTDQIKRDFLPSVIMLTLPHHGSETTTFNLTGSGGGRDDREAVENVETFVAKTAPASVTASAERVRTFKHPSAFLLQFFWGVIGSGHFTDPNLSGGQHYYTAYFTPDDGYQTNTGSALEPFPREPWWYTVQTAKDIFSNLYFDPDMIPDKTGHRTAELPPNPGNIVSSPSATPYPPLGVAWLYTSPEDENTTIDYIVNRPSLLALRRRLVAALTTTPDRTESPGGSWNGSRRWRSPTARAAGPSRSGVTGGTAAHRLRQGRLAGLRVLL